jgi:uncharacterized membrane protein YdbT with pleckstrin-like domain
MPEQTYMILRPTRLAFLKWYAAAMALFVLGGSVFILANYSLYALLLFLAVGAISILAAELMRRYELYAITSTRIVEKSGIINTDEDSIYWEKLSNYSFKQSFFDRIFDIGTVEIWSVGGEDTPEIVLKKVPNLKKVVSILDKLVQRR